jgi:hypothetical protein
LMTWSEGEKSFDLFMKQVRPIRDNTWQWYCNLLNDYVKMDKNYFIQILFANKNIEPEL